MEDDPMAERITRIPLDQPGDQGAWANVGSVIYRDSIDGVRYTAHHYPGEGYWITCHGPHAGNATDGPGVSRSVLWYTRDPLNRNWNALRASRTTPRK